MADGTNFHTQAYAYLAQALPCPTCKTRKHLSLVQDYYSGWRLGCPNCADGGYGDDGQQVREHNAWGKDPAEALEAWNEHVEDSVA